MVPNPRQCNPEQPCLSRACRGRRPHLSRDQKPERMAPFVQSPSSTKLGATFSALKGLAGRFAPAIAQRSAHRGIACSAQIPSRSAWSFAPLVRPCIEIPMHDGSPLVCIQCNEHGSALDAKATSVPRHRFLLRSRNRKDLCFLPFRQWTEPFTSANSPEPRCSTTRRPRSVQRMPDRSRCPACLKQSRDARLSTGASDLPVSRFVVLFRLPLPLFFVPEILTGYPVDPPPIDSR